jgi:two-component system, OmpR family, sensor kinase
MKVLPRSLRGRLLTAAVMLAVAGMIVVNVVAVLTLRSNLLDRADEELGLVPTPGPVATSPSSRPPGALATLSPEFLGDRVIARLSLATGEVEQQITGPVAAPLSAPDLSGVTAAIVAKTALPSGVFTLASVDGTQEAYRAKVLSAPAGGGDVIVMAKSLSEVTATVRRVTLVDAVVSLVVAILLVGVGVVVVRLGLRELSDVEDAAARISEGDLRVRAPHADDPTEVGSLARTFNTMVDQIEQAFSSRDVSEKRLRQFLADASHELRTPVTSIRASSELFRQGALTADREAMLAIARIEAESMRMGVLVDDLLLLARLDQQPELRLTHLDLADLARDVASGVAATSAGHSIVVTGDASADVVGDRDGLRRVLVNLLGNAILYTPSGTDVTITVVDSHPAVSVTVSDDGPGMSEDAAKHAFDRFYRPDTGRARSVAGSGLGLAIVSSVVQAHEGTVTLQTAPGQGATFTVTLPALGPRHPQGSWPEPSGDLQPQGSEPSG